ncbi:MAG: hypothetical protein VX589_13185 [Myxococcota bacterium]|nr:hypothetical protein [Myxococcota bacterium]
MPKKKKKPSQTNLIVVLAALCALGLVAALFFNSKSGGSKPRVGLRGAPESQVCRRAKASLELCVQRNQKMGIKACGSPLAEVTKECDVRGR